MFGDYKRVPPPPPPRAKHPHVKVIVVLMVLMSCVFRHVDTNSKNVFGQPRLRASLRDLRSPRRTYKSTIEDDLKKLIIMDNPGETPQRDPVRTTPGRPDRLHQTSVIGDELTFATLSFQSPRRTLQRTFSDESLCSGRREASFANSENQMTPTDVLFTSTLPTRRHAVSSNQIQAKKGEFRCQVSEELSLESGTIQTVTSSVAFIASAALVYVQFLPLFLAEVSYLPQLSS